MAESNSNAENNMEAAVKSRKVVSLATLSAHLGLSRAAISRVLSGAAAARSIPKATQDRIFAAAEELGYRPNLVARSLRQGRSMTIGVLVPEISEGFVTSVLAGMEKVFLEAGYVFLLVSHHHCSEVMQHSEGLLMERAVDGIIAVDTAFPCRSMHPTVSVSCPEKHARGMNVVLNHRKATSLALEHLVKLGHRRIAVIKGQSFSSDSELRWQGICEAAKLLPLEIVAVEQLVDDLPTHDPGFEAMQRLMNRPEKFTAVFCFNDVSAIGAIHAIRERGFRVPEEISVVGFDDIPSAAFQNPGLTTVRQPLRRMGELAAETLLEEIVQGRAKRERRSLVVEPELIVRASTAVAAGA